VKLLSPFPCSRRRVAVDVAYLIVTLVTAAANAGIALLDFVRHHFVVGNSRRVGVPLGWLPMLGALKLAGAIGLIVGLLGVRVIGIAAAVGLVLFFVGAVVTHVRARAFATIVGPGVFLALAIASLALAF
jgi:hypothetical protein